MPPLYVASMPCSSGTIVESVELPCAVTGLSHSSIRKIIRLASGQLVASHSAGLSIFCCIAITLPPARDQSDLCQYINTNSRF